MAAKKIRMIKIDSVQENELKVARTFMSKTLEKIEEQKRGMHVDLQIELGVTTHHLREASEAFARFLEKRAQEQG